MSKTHNIDVKDILKDVEVCLTQGLERKISSFFDDYTMFQKTHNEVLNLSIVKKMLLVNGSECKHDYTEHTQHNKRSETMYHESILSRYETEIENLKNENTHLTIELEKYKKYLDFCTHKDEDEDKDENEGCEQEEELLFQSINLEITEKHNEMKDTDTDADSNSILQIQIENNIKNIVLNNANKDDVEEEEEEDESDTEEEEEEEEDESDIEEEDEEEDESDTEEEEEEVKAEVEEEEEVVVKEKCVSTAVEIHCCSSDSEEEENLIKSLDNSEEEEEEEEEEVMPTFPTAQELTKLKETNYVVSVEEVEETEEAEVEADANSVESENDVQAEEEEEEEEEELFEVQINGIMYVSNDDEDGTIYSYVDEEVGDEIGKFIGKVAHIYSGANKGVYDRTKCNFNF
jgi:hypothetical protein